jgi:threonine dehydrogenase-like Zn-dependent dehydrogenase
MVQRGPRTLEITEIEVPAMRAGEALLRVEACGLCGSDIDQYEGRGRTPMPLIPGHEPIGVIEEISAEAAKTWGVAIGDRVAVMPHITCGRCEFCVTGMLHLCPGALAVNVGHYGMTPLDYDHGLWGGYSEYIQLHPRTLLLKLPESLPTGIATMYQALAAGLRWAVQVPQAKQSDTVLVMGCGQRGLACVIALRTAGVRTIIVTGLSRDGFKLDQAVRLGASHVIDVEREDTVDRVKELTMGRGVDIVVDVAPGDPRSFLDAVGAVRVGGTVVLGAVKTRGMTTAFDPNLLQSREIRVQGVFTQGYDCYEAAIGLLEREQAMIAPLHTHEMPLDRVEDAIKMLSGEAAGAQSICISVTPQF